MKSTILAQMDRAKRAEAEVLKWKKAWVEMQHDRDEWWSKADTANRRLNLIEKHAAAMADGIDHAVRRSSAIGMADMTRLEVLGSAAAAMLTYTEQKGA